MPLVTIADAAPATRSPRATLTTTTRTGAAPTLKRKESTMDQQVSLWRAMAAGEPAAREQLLKEHLGLVHHVARQMSKTLAVKADFDELVSSGSIGLMSALEAFDVDRGLAFSTFAAPRIRGAILDELRRQDHVPRSIRRKTREIGQARETLGRVLGRSPSDKDVAEHLGLDLPTLWKWRSDIEGAHHVPLDRSPSETETLAPTPIEVLADESNDSVDDIITHEQEVHHLRDAIMQLKEQERTVLSLYYFEEMKLHEIADSLSLKVDTGSLCSESSTRFHPPAWGSLASNFES
ncbi:MAG: sigma-70 family RNA polymerase sigma factor [Gemmatimonadaceae bacterium]|nr:sigma-70 family RNA polymerase sigma factor [Gemmatimonadaceae bacterium]